MIKETQKLVGTVQSSRSYNSLLYQLIDLGISEAFHNATIICVRRVELAALVLAREEQLPQSRISIPLVLRHQPRLQITATVGVSCVDASIVRKTIEVSTGIVCAFSVRSVAVGIISVVPNYVQAIVRAVGTSEAVSGITRLGRCRVRGGQ